MSCPEGFRPCARGCGGCVPNDDGDGMHDDCDPQVVAQREAVRRAPPLPADRPSTFDELAALCEQEDRPA